MTDSTTRFTSRTDTYARYRPGYPPAIVKLLAQPGSVIADVGSGTGLLSVPFLDAGFEVVGVEPNREMREAGDRLLAGYPRFRSVAATAEATSLPDNSVDLIVAGQAFHWFRVPETRREWVRIFKPGGIAALIWNERDPDTPLMREIETVIDKFAVALDPDGSIREAGRSRIEPFFAPSAYRVDEFPNSQEFGLEGLLGRIASCSYLPGESDADYPAMAAELEQIFGRYQQGGKIPFEYRTKVFWGRL